MLPVVAGRETTVGNIFLYSIVLIALSLIFAATNAVGLVYLGSAALLGSVFLLLAWKLRQDSTASNARKLYLYSLLYLALLFVAMLVDSLTTTWL
jgi:protoheme IX farnesyltransferase